MSEHKYDEDGQCEVCGQHRDCHPADVRTITTPTVIGLGGSGGSGKLEQQPQEWIVVNLTGDHWDLRDKSGLLIWSAGIKERPLLQSIADKHNAELAAAKQDEIHWKTRRTLLKELATEREKRKAENLEWVKTVADQAQSHDDDNLANAKALDAEREKRKLLADALEGIRNLTEALAKAKEGK